MILNYEEIKKKALITDFLDENFENASYDLSVDQIITVKGKKSNKLKIQPNGMAVVISQETVKIPNNIIGHAFVKTRLSQKGIMANNIGIIDPGYDGPLSTVLVNFGKEAYELKKGDIFLRITFSKFKKPKDNIDLKYGPFDRKEYVTDKRSAAMTYLGHAFVDIEENISKKVTSITSKMATNFGLWAAAFGLLFAAVTFLFSIKDDDSQKIKNLQEQINLFNSNQMLLLESQELYKKKIDSLNLVIEKFVKTNEQLTVNDKGRSQ